MRDYKEARETLHKAGYSCVLFLGECLNVYCHRNRTNVILLRMGDAYSIYTLATSKQYKEIELLAEKG